MEDKHIYSKMWPILTCLIFLYCVYAGFTASVNSVVDVSVYVSAIGASAAIFGSSLVWYSKKRARENAYSLRLDFLNKSTDKRFEFNEKMVKLMKDNNLTENDLLKIDENGSVDESMDESYSDTKSIIDNAQTDSETDNQIETFNL